MMSSISFRFTVRIIAVGTSLAIPIAAKAVPPANDTCSGSIVLTLPPGSPVAFDISGAEATADAVDMGGCNSTTTATAGVWWRFDASTAGAVWINETSVNNIATGVWVMDTIGAACPVSGPATQICNNEESFNFGVLPNKTYYILIQSQTGTQPTVPYAGAFTFLVVPNDDCANALVLTLPPEVPVSFAVEHTGATTDPIDIGTCDNLTNAPNGVWWRYDATAPGAVHFKEVGAPAVSLGAWEMDSASANCPTIGPSTFCRQGEETFFSVQASKTYYILVHRRGSSLPPSSGISGTFTFIPTPNNDSCNGALDVNSALAKYGPFFVAAVNGAATNDAETGVTCNSYGLWYKYVVPEPGTYLYVAETGPQISRTGRFYGSSGVCPPDVTLLCTDLTIETWIASTAHAVGLTHMYCIGLNGTQQGATIYPLQLTFAEFPPNSNEDCASAREIAGPGTFTVSSVGMADATDNSPIPCGGLARAMVNDSWFKWVATSNGTLVVAPRVLPEPTAGQYAVYSGGPGPGVCPTGGAGLIACGTHGRAGISDPLPGIPVTYGNVYYFQFGTTAGLETQRIFVDFDFSPMSLGACCVESVCSMKTPGECAAVSGAYAGDGTFCSAPTGSISEFSKSASPFNAITTQNSPVGIWQSTVDVPDDFPIGDIEVDFIFGHTINSDLIITLENELRRVVLYNRGRIAADHTGITAPFLSTNLYTWSDAGTVSIYDVVASNPLGIPTGIYKPCGVRGLTRGIKGTFNGLSAHGKWRLTVHDLRDTGGGTGAAVSWTLRLKHGTAPSCATPCACPGDINGSTSRNGEDVQRFASCMIAAGAGCGCADVDGVPGLSSSDTEAFVDLLLNSPACP